MSKKLATLLLFSCVFNIAGCNSNNVDSPNINEKTAMSGVVFEDKTIDYDGNTHTITASGYPDGSVLTYTNEGPFSDCGNYTISVNITHENYLDFNASAILTINQIAMTGVVFSDSTVDYDGNNHTITAIGYPEGSNVAYTNNGPFKDVGEYEISVNITHKNYITFQKTAILTIKNVEIPTPPEPREGIGGIEDYDDSNWKTSDLISLDCGSYQMPLPKNYKNPFNLKTTLSADNSSWSNNNVTDLTSLKNCDFRYIYKNSCDDGPSNHKNNGDFYAPSAGGGIQFSTPGEGFQSSQFYHNGAKLEFSFTVSAVTNSSKKPDKNKDMAHLYLFDKKGTLLDTIKFDTDSIKTKTQKLHFYYTGDKCKDISYFEFRLVTNPFAGSQCYNFGISDVNFKSWERI